MPKRVVVLSKHSLLTDGIVSQLREYEHIFDVTVVDMQNAAAKLLKINPEILIGNVQAAQNGDSVVGFTVYNPHFFMKPFVQIQRGIQRAGPVNGNFIEPFETKGFITFHVDTVLL